MRRGGQTHDNLAIKIVFVVWNASARGEVKDNILRKVYSYICIFGVSHRPKFPTRAKCVFPCLCRKENNFDK